MFRTFAIAAPLVLATLTTPLPALAQDAQANQPPAVANSRCDNRDQRRRRGRGIGSVLGTAAGRFGGSAGTVASLAMNVLPVGELLGEAIASMLDRCEQQQAARATEEATRGGVGTTSTWTSETRPGVTGSSVVTAQAANTPQGECMTVTDIVIVDGEETRAPKQMCRRPPSTRYVRV